VRACSWGAKKLKSLTFSRSACHDRASTYPNQGGIGTIHLPAAWNERAR
jgi:hypothetical protein